VAELAEPLLQTIEAVAALDLALAKARLSFDMRAHEPLLIQERSAGGAGGHPRHRIDLRQARHPLLDPATVVPIDVRLGDTYRILIITGPNTGGKSVALKTVGLLALMAQTGLFIPAADGSRLSVFSAIFADIGDEQSIEQSLSTFSSHITKIIAMLRAADPDSLILIDEVGAGTDPEEGSALARAVIDALLRCGPLAVVTTHYSELKAYAYVTAGTENASVEFDLRTLSPTYRLVIGVAGQSNALAIAQRLGMPGEVIRDARALLKPGAERTEQVLGEIQRRRDEAEAALRDARAARETALADRAAAAETLRAADEARSAAREEAMAELADEVQAARDLVRRLRSRPAPPEAAPVAPEVPDASEVREEVRRAEQRLRELTRRRQRPRVPAQPLRVGDTVEVRSLGMTGEVVSFSEDGEAADVQVGVFKVRQPLASLRRATVVAERRPRSTAVSVPAAPEVEQEIQLLGRRAVEVEEILDRYLDDAARASLPWVRIVHGKGTGALRTVVQDLLRRHPLVERFETAEPNVGGEGVTIAFLRD
ncbi:MAG TPA: Smr/MutS family protein, partial [Thermomicrobiaceae bacterium]|nr:Smr/MutS family protein [Thermomicrobiaceae bacterium]